MIFDCFSFFNEFDLLEIRLRELWDVVDYFIAVESGVTFNGRPKSLFLAENLTRVAWAMDKLHIYVTSPRVPVVLLARDFRRIAAMERVRLQQDIMPAHCRDLGAQDDDVMLLSDVDEIPRAQAVRAAASIATGGKFVSCKQRMYIYYVNFYQGSGWQGTAAARIQDLPSRFSELRLVTRGKRGRLQRGEILPNAGWHFSFMGGAKRVQQKITSYAHLEWNRPQYTNLDRIEQRMQAGVDPFDRGRRRLQRVKIDDTFPKELREHPEKYAHLIAREE